MANNEEEEAQVRAAFEALEKKQRDSIANYELTLARAQNVEAQIEDTVIRAVPEDVLPTKTRVMRGLWWTSRYIIRANGLLGRNHGLDADDNSGGRCVFR